MRRTAVVFGVAAASALLTGAGVAFAATGDGGDPGVAHGYYVAMNGTSDSGAWAATSDTLVDPQVGPCYDLTSLTTGPAAWTESVNRTDKVAVLSPRSCADRAQAATTGGPDGATETGSRPDTVVSDGHAWRSVTFLNLP